MIKDCRHLFFEALSSPLRLSIVDILLIKPSTVTELSERLNAEQSRISHALTALIDCRLIDCDKDGKSRVYHVKEPVVKEIMELVRNYARKNCSECTRMKRK